MIQTPKIQIAYQICRNWYPTVIFSYSELKSQKYKTQLNVKIKLRVFYRILDIKNMKRVEFNVSLCFGLK